MVKQFCNDLTNGSLHLLQGGIMRKLRFLAILMVILAAGNAMAAEIGGRIGLTGKVGVFVPAQDDFITDTTDAKAGFAAGGGLIYGLGRHLAAELDITHVPNIDVEQSGQKVGEASTTDISLGLQYRFAPASRLVPYLGAGVDFISGDFENQSDKSYDLDWTFGGHVNAGVDYFATRGVALTAEIKGIFAAKGDIKTTSAEYDPTGFIGTVGIRLFMPEKIVD